MKPATPPRTASRPRPPDPRPAPAQALERPANLKKWASEVVRVVEGQGAAAFDGFDFGPGALTRADMTRILKKISGCGSVVELRAAMDRATGEIGVPVVHAANYCGQHSICPYCAGRVQDRRGARFAEPIKAMARAYKFAYLLTATIPPCETWREDLGRLIDGWQAFRRMGQKRAGRRGARSAGEWGKVRAGLAKIELKRGDGSGLPHCHYHALVFTSEMLDYRVWKPGQDAIPRECREPVYRLPRRLGRVTWRPARPAWRLRPALRGWVPGSKLTKEWFAATDGAINFRVDPLRMRPADRKAGRSYEESIFDQSREVLKYATKFDSRPEMGAEKLYARDFVGIRDATYNRRLFVSYGDFRKVGGDDFTGGGPHISEGPAIFESRWRGVEYSELISRSRPVFANSDKTPAVSARLTILNRVQGQLRRVRSAILGAKRHYLETGELRPAFYARREYAEDGTFKEHLSQLEAPAGLAANPGSMPAWEQWIDSTMEKGRAHYASVRERLSLESMEGIDGTIEERAAMEAIGRAAWRGSEDYERELIRLFRQTINESREMIHGPP